MMERVETIKVKVRPQPYPVVIGSGILRKVGKELGRRWERRTHFFVITNATVWKHWGAVLTKSMADAKLEFKVLEIGDGEQHKNLDTVEKLAEQLALLNADRTAVFLAFGGGVVGDIVGFLAAIYMRGVPVVQIPTTLLAQVDASVGGKTGVNLAAGKNLVGSFHQPHAVFIDPLVLATLPAREYRAGLFEVIKCGVIRSPKLFALLESSQSAVLKKDAKAVAKIIEKSVRIKALVVEADEKENDLRRILNFGHTVGHAVESTTGYKQFLHGEGVAWGMVAAVEMARESGMLKPKIASRIEKLVLSYEPPGAVTSSVTDLLGAISRDKKTLHGVPHFVLPTRIGSVEIVKDLSEATILRGIEHMKAISAAQR